jgi:hypothetical protein
MGAVSFSIDATLVERLREALPLAAFVETGTFEGDAVTTVRPLFDEVHTIELAETYYAKAVNRFRSDEAVHIYRGHSSQILNSLRPRLENKSVLYWLDAHWCVATDAAGAHSQCPLLEELDAIGTLNSESVVLIDDARLFLCTPPDPHETEDWPRFQDVLQRLLSLSPTHEIMVINDVIAFYPASIASDMSEYARAYSIDWLAALHRLEVIEKDHQVLTSVLAERLALIEEIEKDHQVLTSVLAERLALIEELDRALKVNSSTSRGALDDAPPQSTRRALDDAPPQSTRSRPT